MAQIGLEVGLSMNLLVSRKKLLGNTGDFLWSYGGYLIVSALCDLCGVVLDESNARNFTIDCIETLHDTLKANLSMNGTNYSLSLNDELMSEFIDFYLAVGEKQYIYNKGDECTDVTGGWVEDIVQGHSKTTYEIKTEDCIQMHCCNIPSFAGARTSKKINFQKYYNEGYINIVVERENIVCANEYSTWGTEMVLNNPMSSSNTFDVSRWIGPKLTPVGIQIRKTKLNITEGYIGCYTSTTRENEEVFNKLHRIWLEKKYDIGDSYVKSLEEYKAKYEKEPSKIILDSSIADIKTKWKKEDTEIYIADGNIGSLPSGVSLAYGQYLFKEGDECTSITGGWQDYYNSGAKFTSTCIYLSQNEVGNMYAGTINSIDFSKYNRMYIDLESTGRVYIYTATQQGGYIYNPAYEGTNRKIVSFDLQEFPAFRQTKKLYCMIYNACTAKIYNIWLE